MPAAFQAAVRAVLPLTFALLAGEASGDHQGASLVEAIRRLETDARFLGIGGPRMRAAGVELLVDSGTWGSIGIMESLKLVLPLLRVKSAVVRRFTADPPDLVIPIDFGYFNVRTASALHSRGMRVLYYFPPRSWSRDAHVSPLLRESVDAVATPFPWSAERFQEAGVPATFVGHPLLDAAARSLGRASLCREFDLVPAQPIVALLPGSRKHEVQALWPPLLRAAARVARRVPGVQFLTPVAPTVNRRSLEATRDRLVEQFRRRELAREEARREIADRHQLNLRVTQYEEHPEKRTVVAWKQDEDTAAETESASRSSNNLLVRLVDGRTADVIAASDVVACCSGTATLEAAILNKPMVVVYRGSWLMALEWSLRKSRLAIPYIAMPNLLAGRAVVRELIQEEASPRAIADEILSLLDRARAEKMRAELAAVVHCLGRPGAVDRSAALAVALARGELSQAHLQAASGAWESSGAESNATRPAEDVSDHHSPDALVGREATGWHA